MINIEIKKHNRFKKFSIRYHDHTENILFWIIQRMPERFIPNFLMDWLDRYTSKRIAQLKQQIIKDNWKEVGLEKALDDIRSR